MLDDFQKSVRLIMTERLSSPFSGAFFFSWFVWNWRTVYYLLYPADNLLLTDRLRYVENNLLNWEHGLAYPFLSAIFLVTLYPFITTGALSVWLRFRKWQAKIKNKIQGNLLLTLDQSIELRLAIERQREELDRLIKSKNDELALLRTENENLRQRIATQPQRPSLPSTQEPVVSVNTEEIEQFFNKPGLVNSFRDVIRFIQGNIIFGADSFPVEVMSYLTSHDIIAKKPGDKALYDFTPKGKLFLMEYANRNLQIGELRNATNA